MEKRGKLFMEKRAKVLLGKYEVDRYLGQGTFAKVYRARNIETNKIVAIKAIARDKVEKEGLVVQTEREITIMRMLKHPNIVQLYDVMNTKDKICLVMEYAKGGELFHKIAKGKLDEDVARNYFQQLITTVDFCHKNGVYHRDLKPENLLLDEKGVLKVSDFGLSALADSKREDGLLHTSCGTPYLAPEVLSKKAYDGAKADIWSCGVILYALLAGQVPFRDRSTILMCRKICEADYSCPRWFPDEVRSLLSKILNPDPDKRILISEIVKTYWFRKGSKSITTRTEVEEPGLLGASAGFDDGNNSEQQELARPTSSNHFDIITLPSNLDLSGLIKIFMVRVASVCSSKFPATLS
ncbi:CBL-interacting protein kinase 18-like [Argentina anserina]|uniref:CBL-interacting protein kinase 18-like n=1 Tax=Argentina anserina TaxID=57926 RepID=UPI00217652A7|nr:CBL-interacting protein kinase 18-like [Potentilla anserina]